MQAGTIQFYWLAVEAQTLFGIILYGAYAVCHLDAVGARHFEFCLVKIWVVGRPQTWLLHLDGALQRIDGAVFTDDVGREFYMMNVWRAHLNAPVVDISLGRGYEPHVAIDARARIPAAVLLLRVVHTDHYLVFPYINIRCDVNPESRVAIGPAASQMTVDINVGIHIDTLEVEANLLTLVCLAQSEHTAIPSLARGQIGPVVACRSIDIEALLDAPVVWQRHDACTGEVAVVECKLPLVVDQLLARQFG